MTSLPSSPSFPLEPHVEILVEEITAKKEGAEALRPSSPPVEAAADLSSKVITPVTSSKISAVSQLVLLPTQETEEKVEKASAEPAKAAAAEAEAEPVKTEPLLSSFSETVADHKEAAEPAPEAAPVALEPPVVLPAARDATAEEINAYGDPLRAAIKGGKSSSDAFLELIRKLESEGAKGVAFEASLDQNKAGNYTPEPYTLPSDLLGPRKCYCIKIHYLITAEKEGVIYRIPLERVVYTTAQEEKEAVPLALAYQKMIREKIAEERNKDPAALGAWVKAGSFTFSKDYRTVSFKEGKTDKSMSLTASRQVAVSWKKPDQPLFLDPGKERSTLGPDYTIFSSEEDWECARAGIFASLDHTKISSKEALDRIKEVKQEIKALEQKNSALKQTFYARSLWGMGEETLKMEELQAASSEATLFAELKAGDSSARGRSLRGKLGDYQRVKNEVLNKKQKIQRLREKQAQAATWTAAGVDDADLNRAAEEIGLQQDGSLAKPEKLELYQKELAEQFTAAEKELQQAQVESRRLENELKESCRRFYEKVSEWIFVQRELERKWTGLEDARKQADETLKSSLAGSEAKEQAQALLKEISPAYLEAGKKRLQADRQSIDPVIAALDLSTREVREGE